jgi:hypothetical protein
MEAKLFKSKSRLEAENVALRHQLIVLRPRRPRNRNDFGERRPLAPPELAARTGLSL